LTIVIQPNSDMIEGPKV